VFIPTLTPSNMYQPTYSSASQQPYSPPSDPYRAAPISVPQKQPYNAAFSPPAPGPTNGFSPMPSGHSSQRYQIYSSSGSGPQSQSHSHSPRQSSSAPRHHTPSGYSNGGAGAFHHPGIPPQQTPQQRFKGTLAPGTVVKVGEQHVRVERYLSEGGYAHVYLTSSERPIYPPTREEKKGRWGERGYSQHCLKRIAFEDEAVWVDVRKEIEVMVRQPIRLQLIIAQKSLPPNPHLTQYLGSVHSRLPNGGYEVFILMEFCAGKWCRQLASRGWTLTRKPGGGIIDLLNKRLRDRLKEIEILNIFADVCEVRFALNS
jgi:AP2-associated kinase